MTKVTKGLFALLLAPIGALAADPGLLNLVMPDAKVVAGLQVANAKSSPFGQYVLAHMQPDSPGFKKFMADTGFDPRRDLHEVVLASNWENNTPDNRFLVVARGVFDPAKIAALVQANGGTVSNFQGVSILSTAPKKSTAEPTAIAFPDNTTGIFGDVPAVEAAIQRKQSNTVASSSLLDKVRDPSSNNDFWFVTLVPLSEFSSAMPDPNLQGAMKGNLLQAVSQASGGVRFGDPVLISGQAVTRSDKDAEALADVVRFLVGMIEQNRDSNPTAGQISELLDTLNLKTSGNVLTMSLSIPEKQLEQIFNGLGHPAPAAAKKTAHAH